METCRPISVLTENITRRRFIKRTGAATVAMMLAMRTFGHVGNSCKCVTVTGPATVYAGPGSTATSMSWTYPGTTVTGCVSGSGSTAKSSRASGPVEKVDVSGGGWEAGGMSKWIVPEGSSVKICGMKDH